MGVWHFFEIRDLSQSGNTMYVLSIYVSKKTHQTTKWEFGRLVVQKGGNKPTPVLDSSGERCDFNGKEYNLSVKNSYGTFDYYGKLQTAKRLQQFVKGERTDYFNKYNTKQIAVYMGHD